MSYSFSKNGYHYFLVSDGDDGYYRLQSDADYPQPLQANEEKPGVITSITNGENILLALGERIEDQIVTEIQKTGSDNVFKVKLSQEQ